MRIENILWLLLPLTIAGCNRFPKKEDLKTPTKEAALTDFQQAAQIGELYPLSNGGAYLASMNGIFYISDGQAIRVKGLQPLMISPEIHPLSNGDAILNDITSSPPALYLLQKGAANIIFETTKPPSKTGQISNSNMFYFLETQRLARKIKENESETNASSDETTSDEDSRDD